MKKWCLMVAAMLCLMIPTVGSAQGLPDFLQAVQSGLSEGLSAGSAAMEKDLALSMTLSDSRVEEGRDVTLTIRAENPRPAETGVSLTLSLPERLAAQTGDELTWNAVLPAAQVDETGAFVPSVTTFTRVLTLMPGGESAQGTVTAEMNVGSRFYRESLPIALCVADISTRARVAGAQNGRATVGETLTYTVADIQIIQPYEANKIKIQPNRDLLTLLTCHPYASGGKQRYVVYCERTKN